MHKCNKIDFFSDESFHEGAETYQLKVCFISRVFSRAYSVENCGVRRVIVPYLHIEQLDICL